MLRALFLLLAMCSVAWGLTAEQLVVVFNGDSAFSREMAERYARVRAVPEQNLVELKGFAGKPSLISREVFDARVRRPLLEAAAQRGWVWPAAQKGSGKRMLALVLMPDLPLRVSAPKLKPGEKPLTSRNKAGAALDSELMLLGAADYPLRAMIANPCYGKDAPLSWQRAPILAVCRIDGPDAATVRHMIDDPVRVEKEGLQGWVVVDEGGPHKEGDVWLRKLAEKARTQGQPVFHESSKARIAEAFPLMNSTAVYFGWYTHLADGPFKAGAPGGFRFAPGAIAVHLHSYSAPSVKSAKNWAGALLQRGAAVSAGNVDEPYLGPTLHFDIFYDRLLQGYAVGEAALMASPVASWQSIVLGDPLYRPFAALKSKSGSGLFAEWRRLYVQSKGDISTMKRALRSYTEAADWAPLAEMLAWRCTEEGRLDDACALFTNACQGYMHEKDEQARLRDRTRTAILAATVLASDGEKERARSILTKWLNASESSPYRPAIQASLDALDGKVKK